MTDDDPFERAVAREDTIRSQHQADNELVSQSGRWAGRVALALAVALPVHVLSAGRWTGWMTVHVSLLVLHVWQFALWRRDISRGVRAMVHRHRLGRVNVTVVEYGKRKEQRW